MKAEYIDHMGDDLAVVNAARVSFDKESDWEIHSFDCEDAAEEFVASDGGAIDWDYVYSDNWFGGYPVTRLSDADARLIQYLAKHNHWSPFAHTSIKLRMTAPVPIRTQCFKHKQGFVENEESRRYISGTPELYVPEFFRSKPEGSIKQGSGEKHLMSDYFLNMYNDACRASIGLYESMIAEGVCPEQARFVLPQGVIVNWIWTGSLYAYANFYNKRTDPDAQKESQDLALKVGEIIKALFPVSWAALTGDK